jgi:hypothetical protein
MRVLRLGAPPACWEFCTGVHRFAQVFARNLIDEEKGKDYFAFQIEPGSLRTLRINLEGAASFTAGCAARLNREARSLNGFVWRARLSLTAVTPTSWFGKVRN